MVPDSFAMRNVVQANGLRPGQRRARGVRATGAGADHRAGQQGDSLRVLEVGLAGPSHATLKRRLPVYANEGRWVAVSRLMLLSARSGALAGRWWWRVIAGCRRMLAPHWLPRTPARPAVEAAGSVLEGSASYVTSIT